MSAAVTLSLRDPRTGRVESTINLSSTAEVRAKAAALRRNQRAWADLPLDARIGIMGRWLAEVRKRAPQIGECDAVDTGGCHTSYAQGFITMANIGGWLEDAREALSKAEFQGRSRVMPDVEIRTQLVPYSVVGVISPWNAPLMLALLDAVPALFAGSAVLLKPSEVTPRVIELLFETVAAVPELAAVFDYVVGAGETGQEVIKQVDLVCFTGSVPTGRKVAVACAERLIPCFLELGGKDPAIVTENADLERATTAVLRGGSMPRGKFVTRSSGSMCRSRFTRDSLRSWSSRPRRCDSTATIRAGAT